MAKKKKRGPGRRSNAELQPVYERVHAMVSDGVTVLDACEKQGVGTSQYANWRKKRERQERLSPALEQVGERPTDFHHDRPQEDNGKYVEYLEERLASMKKLNLRLLDAVKESMI